MDSERVKQYLRDFQERDLPGLVERDLQTPETDKIVSVYGPRRSGKTFYMYQKIVNLLDSGVDKDQVLYLDFEDTRLSGVGYKDFEDILKLHWELNPESSDKELYIFLDEVQVIEDWEKAVRTLYSRGYDNIFITGSSATLLSKEIATQLRGRTLSYMMLPLSFREYLEFKDFPVQNIPDLSSENEAEIKSHFENYVEWGGFPEVVEEENEMVKTQILQEYREMVVYKDVIERHSIQNPVVIKTLIEHLYSSFAAPFSPHNLYNTLKSQGIKVSKKTVYNYTEYLEEALGVFMLEKWSPSSEKRNLSKKKAYLPDTGFGNLYTTFSDKKGQLLENIVFLHLKRRQNQHPQEELYYWQNENQEEVDFMLKEKQETKALIQVSHSIDGSETREREISALLKASKQLEPEKLRIVTWDTERTIEEEETQIELVPAWKFLPSPDL